MNIIEQRKLIRETILGMEQPFTRGDLCRKIIRAYPEIKSGLVLDVLDELCDSEVVKVYLDVDNNEIYFSVVGKTAQ